MLTMTVDESSNSGILMNSMFSQNLCALDALYIRLTSLMLYAMLLTSAKQDYLINSISIL